ncbi:PQQ-binding-like beta-propeller repeat protein [Pedobacter sp. JY14-1]|uniref:outer membrane protein assembly factor BamB family protein n=1 Tax=Pedobacter sp. JY14-1 TaxID=3034151 RepID=UPI0023E1F3AD|nr:PQQ-binding-like beta-propeller repeat protein [Pedobacter sp. JY14-1]
MNLKTIIICGISAISSLSLGYTLTFQQENSSVEWPEYLGGSDRNHYSPLKQINARNVKNLEKAWEYHSADSGQVQCNPIVIAGTLYGVTASNHAFALDAATGAEKWRFRPSGQPTSNTNRGLTYWSNGNEKRILYAYDSFLYALNAQTGKPVDSFGELGRVSLRTGLEANAKDRFVISNTPGALFEDLIVMPLRVGEEEGAAIGYLQAFNVKTGKLAWVFKTIPDCGQPGAETWPADIKSRAEVGATNNWSGIAVDKKRGMLFVPTGSAAFDFYGGNRKGKNLYANCLLAINARTGNLIWYYQLVHHDVWDRDLPAPPNLVQVTRNGRKTDAVAQVTKHGYVFVFDRLTGKPIFPIDEKPFPASDVPGEQTWPTQPIPRMPLPFSRQNITEKEISNIADNRQELLETFRKARKGTYRPLAINTETLIFPGADGGAEWGGAAADPEGVLYVNSNEMPWLFSLSHREDNAAQTGLSPGHLLYNNTCASCHGQERRGNPKSGYPALTDIRSRKQRREIDNLIRSGKGMMPGFTGITPAERQTIIDFLFGEEKTEAPSSLNTGNRKTSGNPYKFNGYNKFLDNNGYPAITPPWGTLTAIDLNTGKHLWQKTLGELPELTAKGIAPTGTENYGGPVVTASGLLFIAATKDGMFRAFDKKTGMQLWQTQLPAAGYATPSTYEVNGRQYVVIACGGSKLGTRKGDSYVAYTLKD